MPDRPNHSHYRIIEKLGQEEWARSSWLTTPPRSQGHSKFLPDISQRSRTALRAQAKLPASLNHQISPRSTAWSRRTGSASSQWSLWKETLAQQSDASLCPWRVIGSLPPDRGRPGMRP
jgi:hypothetical protein